ncbi:MAG: nucleotidyltransferase family protein [Solidesulfovibrio sp. DCME]|uniref:nucleotidyltransferase family protein n=1 Tax=Solidesulfovibrio sp. DCME TaxID=3447380 RepID=UPI003D0CF448
MISKALILSAGLGTRLKPLTDVMPKPMVPVAGRPVLEHLVRLCVAAGIADVAINLHHLPHVVMDHCGNGGAFGARLLYGLEPELLGTAGAVNNFRDFFTAPFLVLYGDVYLDVDLRAFAAAHEASGAVATVGLYRVDNPTECGLVDRDPDGRITRFVEKPPVAFTDLANAGVYALSPKVLDYIPEDGFCDFGHDVFPALLAAGEPLYGQVLDGYVMDIGSPQKLEKANAHVAGGGKRWGGGEP